MSGRLFLILSAVIAIFGIFSWNVINRMSIEAIGMAIGMTLGVVAGIPTTALIVLASRRDAEDGYREDGEYYPRTVDQYQQSQYPQPAYTPVAFQDSPVVPWRSAPTPAPICQEDVTPYYNVVRRLLGDEPLPSRADLEPKRLTAQQILELEDYILYQQSGGIHQVDPRKYIVRFSGDAR